MAKKRSTTTPERLSSDSPEVENERWRARCDRLKTIRETLFAVFDAKKTTEVIGCERAHAQSVADSLEVPYLFIITAIGDWEEGRGDTTSKEIEEYIAWRGTIGPELLKTAVRETAVEA